MTDAVCELTSPDHDRSLLCELYKLQRRGYMCDVVLVSGAGVLPAHRLILVAASPYFKQRLGPENLSPDNFNVKFEDVDLTTLAAVVEFIYTGSLKISKENINPIQTFCEEVKLINAVKICKCYRNRNMINSQSVKTENTENTQHELVVKVPKDSLQSTAQRGTKRKRTRAGIENNIANTCSVKTRKRSLENVLGAKFHNTPVSESELTLNIPNLQLSMQYTPVTEKPAISDKASKSAKKVRRGRKCKSKQLPSVSKLKDSNRTTSRLACDKNTGKNSRFEKCVKQNLSYSKLETSISKCDETVETCNDNVSDDAANTDNNTAYEDNENEENDDFTDDVKQFTNIKVKPIIMAKLKAKSNEHISSRKNKLDYPTKCELCNEMLTDEKTLKTHMKQQHKETGIKPRKKATSENWPCCVCGRQLTSAVRQACHLYSKHGIPYDESFKLHACDVEGCKYITASKHYLQIHQKGRHGNERPHICDYCGKGFKLPSALATHLNIHTQSLVHRCSDCDLTFNQKGGLEIHIKKHHKGEASWTELCHLCSEKFMQKAELCWHMYKAHRIPLPDRYKVYSCAFCDYQTIRKNKMQRHMDAHDDKRNYTCTVCGKKFATKSYLNRHVRYHGEKNFKCTYDSCTYCCVDQVGLNKHVRLVHTHKNYKPFVCSICPYKSGLRGNLDKHIRTVHNLEVVTKHTVRLKMKFRDRASGDILTKDGQYIHKVVDQRGMSHLQLELSDSSLLGKRDCETDQDICSAGIDEAQTAAATRSPTAHLPSPLPPDTVPPPPHLSTYLYPAGQLMPGTGGQVPGPFTLVPDGCVTSQVEPAVYMNVGPMAFVANSNKFPEYY